MALRRLSLPIIFAALLLCSLVFARELEETPAADQKDADFSQTQIDGFNENKQYGYGGGYGYRPRYGYGHGGGYGYGRGGGYGGRYGGWCRYRCGYRCCSAEEYAEFVQAGN